jgi:hypothetical protein
MAAFKGGDVQAYAKGVGAKVSTSVISKKDIEASRRKIRPEQS